MRKYNLNSKRQEELTKWLAEEVFIKHWKTELEVYNVSPDDLQMIRKICVNRICEYFRLLKYIDTKSVNEAIQKSVAILAILDGEG